MKNIPSKYSHFIFTFLVGGAFYNTLEIVWRGYTHISMTLLGGFCFVYIYLIQNSICAPSWLKALFCSIFITYAEFLTGFVVNIILKLNIWNYSQMPFNLLGQICVFYSVLWYFLSFAAMFFAKQIFILLNCPTK